MLLLPLLLMCLYFVSAFRFSPWSCSMASTAVCMKPMSFNWIHLVTATCLQLSFTKQAKNIEIFLLSASSRSLAFEYVYRIHICARYSLSKSAHISQMLTNKFHLSRSKIDQIEYILYRAGMKIKRTRRKRSDVRRKRERKMEQKHPLWRKKMNK